MDDRSNASEMNAALHQELGMQQWTFKVDRKTGVLCSSLAALLTEQQGSMKEIIL